MVQAADPDKGAAIIFSALAFASQGDLDRAKRWIDRALLLDSDNQFMRFNLAMAQTIFFGDKNAAVETIKHSLAKGGPYVVTLVADDPNLDALRDDPRFQQMLSAAKERVGLAKVDVSPAAEVGAPLRS